MSRMAHWFVFATTVMATTVISGCVCASTLDHATIEYDKASAQYVSRQLLLNIARARYNEPMHFTTIPSITATYNGAARTAPNVWQLMPPTGDGESTRSEAHTQQFFVPFREQELMLLFRLGYEIDSLLRLMGAEVRLEDMDGSRASENRPAERNGYVVYRRVMTHLSTIQRRQGLYVEALRYTFTKVVPAANVTPEAAVSTYKDFSVACNADRHECLVSKQLNGRTLITNYDSSMLPKDERIRLQSEAATMSPNEILLDIRVGHVGGEYPMHGRLRLRSFHEVLDFVGRGIAEEPEFDVAPDSRTPLPVRNPVCALEISETPAPPSGGELSVKFRDRYYSVRQETGDNWNRKAFSLLSLLFHLSVSESAVTTLAISK